MEGQLGGIPDFKGKKELLNGDKMPTVLQRVALPRDRQFVQVQAYADWSYALDEFGKVWMWGQCALP